VVQRLFGGEEYTLQIDSHMRFARHWDETLKSMLRTLASQGFAKPLLTGYLPAFELDGASRLDMAEPPLRMVYDRFLPEGVVLFKADTISGWQKLHCTVPERFVAAGFSFTLGQFCREVPYD
jgi:hypothetical protein